MGVPTGQQLFFAPPLSLSSPSSFSSRLARPPRPSGTVPLPAKATRVRRRVCRGALAEGAEQGAESSSKVSALRDVSTLSGSEALVDRADFPILSQLVNDKLLVYLDSAATSQKPRVVIDALTRYYETTNSNVHRGAHTLASRATAQFELTRTKLASLIGAADASEVIYTRNATEGINVIAQAWGRQHVGQDDVIFVSEMEHHANLVPWQMLAEDVGARIETIPLLPDCSGYDVDAFVAKLKTHAGHVRIVTMNHVSNVLGCVNPVSQIAAEVRRVVGDIDSSNVCIVCDACQSVPHMPVDVSQLGADFVVASAHKMLGPTGVGFIWGKYDTLSSMRPFLYGGEMIQDVFVDRSTFTTPPHRFEAGTPSIAEAVAFGSAMDYLTMDAGGMHTVHEYEEHLAKYLWQRLSEFKEVTVYGPPPPRAALCAFNVDGVHSGDLATLLDVDAVAVRSGHHCAQPLHRKLGIQSSARASLYVYNTRDEVDKLIAAMQESVTLLGEKLTLKIL